MEQVLFSQVTLTELLERFSSIVDEKIKPFLPAVVAVGNSNEIYLSRIEVSKQLKISLPTLNNLTKKGVITGYRIGRRVLYKSDEIHGSLHLINANKYKKTFPKN